MFKSDYIKHCNMQKNLLSIMLFIVTLIKSNHIRFFSWVQVFIYLFIAFAFFQLFERNTSIYYNRRQTNNSSIFRAAIRRSVRGVWEEPKGFKSPNCQASRSLQIRVKSYGKVFSLANTRTLCMCVYTCMCIYIYSYTRFTKDQTALDFAISRERWVSICKWQVLFLPIA